MLFRSFPSSKIPLAIYNNGPNASCGAPPPCFQVAGFNSSVFFQAEGGVRDIGVTWSSDVCSSDLACAITATTPVTHAIIRANLHRSAAYGGGIEGRGPRYCPSVEDKVVRLAERERHQIFLEPEEIGRASCRARVEISVGAVSLQQ